MFALIALLVLATAMSVLARVRLERKIWIAGLRACAQLAAVSLIITAALSHLIWALAFVLLMFAVAVFTSASRCGVRNKWPWVALSMIGGVGPVLAIIFGSGVTPLNGAALVPIAGIIIGNTMTGHTLFGRRTFAELRAQVGTYEAGLSIGLTRSQSISLVIEHCRADALLPTIDTTRTVGLVTLPGAFIGVLLGGGSPLEAGAAQVLVLLGILAAQFTTVTIADRLVCSGKELPADLAAKLRP